MTHKLQFQVFLIHHGLQDVGEEMEEVDEELFREYDENLGLEFQGTKKTANEQWNDLNFS